MIQETVFQFKFNKKPVYISKSINYKKAYLSHILRSLFLNKIRYGLKLYSYFKTKRLLNYTSKMSKSELEQMTSLCRPGKLSS